MCNLSAFQPVNIQQAVTVQQQSSFLEFLAKHNDDTLLCDNSSGEKSN
jgi:hypothetical protein